jgi:hypothetical protein
MAKALRYEWSLRPWNGPGGVWAAAWRGSKQDPTPLGSSVLTPPAAPGFNAVKLISNEFFGVAAGGTLNFRAATFTATGSLVTTELLTKRILSNMTATGTLSVQKWIAKGVSFSATGVLSRQRLVYLGRSFTATGSLAVTAGRLLNVAANMAATGTLAVSRQLSMGVSKAFSAIGTLVTAETFIPGAVGPVILAEQVRRFFRYLGRRW